MHRLKPKPTRSSRHRHRQISTNTGQRFVLNIGQTIFCGQAQTFRFDALGEMPQTNPLRLVSRGSFLVFGLQGLIL